MSDDAGDGEEMVMEALENTLVGFIPCHLGPRAGWHDGDDDVTDEDVFSYGVYNRTPG